MPWNNINSLWPGNTTGHQWTESSLFQIIACCQFGTKPLIELMLIYCKLDLQEYFFCIISIKIQTFSARKNTFNMLLSTKCLPFCSHLNVFINSLWPDDAIWWHRSVSTLAQVMACCLTAPSHYLNQCWLIISKVLWHSTDGIIIRRFEDISKTRAKISLLKLHPDLPGANELR